MGPQIRLQCIPSEHSAPMPFSRLMGCHLIFQPPPPSSLASSLSSARPSPPPTWSVQALMTRPASKWSLGTVRFQMEREDLSHRKFMRRCRHTTGGWEPQQCEAMLQQLEARSPPPTITRATRPSSRACLDRLLKTQELLVAFCTAKYSIRTMRHVQFRAAKCTQRPPEYDSARPSLRTDLAKQIIREESPAMNSVWGNRRAQFRAGNHPQPNRRVVVHSRHSPRRNQRSTPSPSNPLRQTLCRVSAAHDSVRRSNHDGFPVAKSTRGIQCAGPRTANRSRQIPHNKFCPGYLPRTIPRGDPPARPRPPSSSTRAPRPLEADADASGEDDPDTPGEEAAEGGDGSDKHRVWFPAAVEPMLLPI
ncbi:hypothetical protein B0H19DRAFT_1375267 [Mycena capillaripes]|nr:hypothetical protein B0H19DRAFT_1375267 [Mycena capillaripes]